MSGIGDLFRRLLGIRRPLPWVTLSELAQFPEVNPGPVLRLDLDAVVQRANEAAHLIFKQAELAGRSWLELCPGMTRERWAEALACADSLSHETMLDRRCLVFAHVPRLADRHVFVYGTDITERRAAEQALQERTRELAELARFPEMNPGLVCRLDRSGRIVLANAAARRLFSDEQLVGKNWLEVCPNLDAARWRDVLEASTTVSHEAQVGECYVVFRHTPGAGQREIFVYGTDLTEQRLAERALRQTEIGIGGSGGYAATPLPHHRTCGSASGGSES